MRRAAGIDLGLVRNATAFVAWEGSADHMRVIDEHEWKPKGVLRLGTVLPSILLRCASLQVSRVGHDQHYAQSVVEAFEEHTGPAIELVRTPAQISATYFAFRRALEEGRIYLFPISKRLREQLEYVAYTVSQAGNILVVLPEMPDGTHCDLVSALLAGYHAMTAEGGKAITAGARAAKLGFPRSYDEENESDAGENE